MINTITITGRCTNAPELRSVKAGKTKDDGYVAEVNIAVNKDKDTVFFFPVVAWGNTAKALVEYVDKGDKIAVSGYLAYKSWENDAGEKRSRTYINATSIEFMTRAEKGEKGKDNYKKRPKPQRDEADDEAFYYDP